MKFTKKDIVKETENAISFNIDNENLWFQKKKILISEDKNNFEILQNIIDEAKKNYQEYKNKPEKKVLISTNETIEDYNDNVYKFIITLKLKEEKEEKEFKKPCFISKKFVTLEQINDNEIELPLWLWNKIEYDLIEDSIKYSNEKYSKNFTSRNYIILNNVLVLE